MHFCKYPTAAAVVALAMTTPAFVMAQSVVTAGSGSFASMPPTYKAKTAPDGPGFNATKMLSRQIFADELPASNVDGIEVPGRPIPTNDWWTDIINNRFSGALWSYPAMLHTSEDGVRIDWPTYWADAGKEIKSRTHLTVSASRFRASAAIAADWHDWDVTFRMPAAVGDGEMRVTAVHGSPFTWFEYSAVSPEVNVGTDATVFAQGNGYIGLRIGDDRYGLYFDTNVSASLSGGKLTLSDAGWLSVALLRSDADLDAFAPYSASIPRDTRVDWAYDEASARISTVWTVTAENLRDPGASAPVLQGFLPHAYKYALPGASFGFVDAEGFVTPRGVMKLGASPSGTFSYSYQFSGMLPSYGAPQPGDDDLNGFSAEVLDRLMSDYAEKGGFGGDTYWGGKGLVQMAMNMSFARQSGNIEVYELSRRRLREAFENWLTYTPGEETTFFSYYPRWGAMLGFDVSYDSDAFNDHHFHYGYFTYAAALLCMEDRDFAEKYGELLTLIAKDYANWDRDDHRFPFMRTLDPWCGHSWAGGLGDHGNDNGNGQESTSEAMQSWGGLYLLGVALGNTEMRDAGLWGWNTEARATREYWYDVDAPRPANDGGRKAWPGKNSRQGNYNYDEYPYAYNSNITGKGIGWWTWFGGDPLFMHGIQWMPISPALDYLSWDTDFVGWAYDDMMRGANSTFSHSWFETTYNTDNGDAIEPLARNDWGNVTLAYLQRHNPREAARIFDQALAKGLHIATSISTSHISYYITHSHLTYGDIDFSIHADIPTAQVRVRDGAATYFVYNPDSEDRIVHFYNASGTLVRTVNAPARRLVGISAESVAAVIDASLDGGNTIPPSGSAAILARVLDQYGAVLRDAAVSMSLSAGAPAAVDGKTLTVNAAAARGTSFVLTLTSGDLTFDIPVTVNDRPVAQSAAVNGVPEICEKNVPMDVTFTVTDQYGRVSSPDDTQWYLVAADGTTRSVSMPLAVAHAGRYTLTARSASADKEASAQLFVTPPMPNISAGCTALASSAENVGTMPQGATDGDNSSRWGSNHTDNEWIVIDLGEDCLVSRVDILWEAAYASRYELQLAPDGCPMQSLTVNWAGGEHQISVPGEGAWITALAESAQGAGHRLSVVNASGRYIRMKGVERGSAYGYSFYEMSVYGLRGSLAADAPLGVDFSLPAVMNTGESITLVPQVYTRGGDIITDRSVVWSADKKATFDGNTFTPLAHGVYTVSAALPGVGSSDGTLFVNDVERPVSVSLDKSEYIAIQHVPLIIPFSVDNQFMAPYSGGADGLGITVLGPDNAPSTQASYDAATQQFVSDVCGTHTLDFGGLGTCSVVVRPISEVNLALGKTAWDSSHENDGLTASFAVDGRTDTRWGSQFSDEQWMIVDLENVYELDRIRIFWNNPAYATDYTVATSLTGYDDDFTDLAHHTGYVWSSDPVVIDAGRRQARYIRLTGHRRSTGYGTSVDEFEVYGLRNVSAADDILAPDTTFGVSDNTDSWYTMQGISIPRPTAPGIYIRRTTAGTTKVVIR